MGAPTLAHDAPSFDATLLVRPQGGVARQPEIPGQHSIRRKLVARQELAAANRLPRGSRKLFVPGAVVVWLQAHLVDGVQAKYARIARR